MISGGLPIEASGGHTSPSESSSNLSWEQQQAAGALGVGGATDLEGSASAPAQFESPIAGPVTRESLRNQLEISYKGYQDHVQALNGARGVRDRITTADRLTAERELEAWIDGDGPGAQRLAYVARLQEADPTLGFTLTPTPNIRVSGQDIISAEALGSALPYETYVHAHGLFDGYSPAELSGTDPDSGDSIAFKLIPNKPTEAMRGTVSQQFAKLAGLQAQNPGLVLKVPSALDAMAYEYTLCAGNGRTAVPLENPQAALAGSGRIHVIRHFDLTPQFINKTWPYVPRSYVDNVIREHLHLGGSGINSVAEAYVAIA